MYKWIFLIVLIISGGILWLLYTNIDKLEKTPGEVPVSSANIVRITHSFKDEVHRFTGEIKLPHSCYAIKTEIVPDSTKENALVISITSTDRMLAQSICMNLPTRYPFEVITEAPEDVNYELRVDGKILSIRVTEVDWASAEGTLLQSL
ncbi:MAG: hypothetical protein UY04_C0018G0010 [Parcubacteria group bacterium GW2011_GWA2_47_7]|nr:MAG: hypothetical protein UY04_C0018G0010 [Parcubacteria group bacterium GW2011_GWA2_47_7]